VQEVEEWTYDDKVVKELERKGLDPMGGDWIVGNRILTRLFEGEESD